MRFLQPFIFILALLGIPLFAQAEDRPKISAWTVKKNSQKKCPGMGTYLGPNNTNHHWGTCVKVEGIQILSKYTLTRNTCKKLGWVYVGPNRAHVHGGYCAKLNSRKWVLRADEERHSKNCGRNSVYAGANNVKAHWGHCLTVVPSGWKPKHKTDKQAVASSEAWEREKRRRKKAQRAAEVRAKQARINNRLADKGNSKPKSERRYTRTSQLYKVTASWATSREVDRYCPQYSWRDDKPALVSIQNVSDTDIVVHYTLVLDRTTTEGKIRLSKGSKSLFRRCYVKKASFTARYVNDAQGNRLITAN